MPQDPLHGMDGDAASARGARAWRVLLALILVCVSLAGCSGGSDADLRSYIEEVKQRKGTRIEELPPIEPYIVYSYPCTGTQGCVDPFEPFFQETPEKPGATATASNGITPDFDRNREELESHPLDSLRMMGTLEKDNEIWGIVRSPDSIIHRVKVGNYMGKNYGRIISISEDKIELTEIVPDGQGGWVERDAALALVE
jgi:type IV pilus assembly protein PilP